MEAGEIEIVPPVPHAPKALAKPTTARAIVMAEALKEDTEQRILLQQYVNEHMKVGTDYGVIPGTQKPTLLKPGAEKLTDLFRCTPSFDLIEKVEDWDRGLFHYMFRVRITSRDAGTVLAEGFGSANSREGRYRWRNANRKCPQCEKETIFRSRNAGEGFYCWRKKGGCGATFTEDDDRITSQTEGRVENDDIFTLVNTILKMAKKRALVDGAIALARCSDIFTQDVEDLTDGEPEAAPRAATRPAPKTNAAKNVTAAAEVLGGKVETSPTDKVKGMWARLVREEKGNNKLAKARWDKAAESVMAPVKSTEWTPKDAEAVDAVLWSKDVLF